MDAQRLFDHTLKILGGHIATKGISARIASDTAYDRDYGARICDLMHRMVGGDMAMYDDAVHEFISFSHEFLVLQAELEKTKRYRYQTFEEAMQNVYDNAEVMGKRYLKGLFLSYAFWINHQKLLQFFNEHFSKGQPEQGSVLEVPVGTGIFLSEFLRQNRSWKGQGFDISTHSIDFSRQMIKAGNGIDVPLTVKDVFEAEGAYDRIVCGELMEHLEDPEKLLEKLGALINKDGQIFLTAAVWAGNIDHIYLFRSAQEVREMIGKHFTIKKELVLNVFPYKKPEDPETPINYACIVTL